jgi:integrase
VLKTGFKDLSLARHRIGSLDRVSKFLTSIERNSRKSRDNYHLGLSRFQDYLDNSYNQKIDQPYTVETILQPLTKNEIDLYELLDSFVSYMMTLKLSVNSMLLYLAAVKSYFGYYDIDVIPSKFRRRVKMPRLPREDEEPLDSKDIRNILLHCNNRRLKSFLLVLASGGTRATEALAIRLKDIDFSVSPTKIRIRSDYAKTRVSRDIYISDEATSYLNQWIDWKYRSKGKWTKTKNEDDLVFTVYNTANKPDPYHIYVKMSAEFDKLLTIVGMGERKEGMRRRLYTLHSFRRHVKSVISNQVNQDFSEMFLGHSKSPYYTLKESERREIYATRIMRYLTFLDYSYLESTSKNIEEKLIEREHEIHMLKQRDIMTTTNVQQLSDQVLNLTREVQLMKKSLPSQI